MPIRKKQKRYVYAATTLAVVAAIAIYSYFVDTRGAALAPKCPIFFATGYKCPGCGTQRALHELFHGNFIEFAGYNPILVIAIPYILILVYLQYLGGADRFPKANNIVAGRPAALAWLFVIIAYWIIRNILNF